MIQRFVIELVIDSADDVGDVLSNVLDNGDLQDAIAGYAEDTGLELDVVSCTVASDEEDDILGLAAVVLGAAK